MFFAYSVVMRLFKLSVVLTWVTVSPVECWEHYRHDDLVVLLYEGHDILIVPEVESSLGNLNNPSQIPVIFRWVVLTWK